MYTGWPGLFDYIYPSTTITDNFLVDLKKIFDTGI